MKTRFLPLLIIIAISSVLVFVVKDFVREVIVEPLLYVGWIAMLAADSVPRALYWLIFVGFSLILAYRSLRRPKTKPQKATQTHYGDPGPVAQWTHMLSESKTRVFRWRLSQTLGKLTWQILGDGDYINARLFQQRVEDGTIPVAPEMAAYLVAGLTPHPPLARRWYQRKVRPQPSPLDLEPEAVVEFLEKSIVYWARA